jgi:hypothetical protein
VVSERVSGAVGEPTEDARSTNETVWDALVILAIRKGEHGRGGIDYFRGSRKSSKVNWISQLRQ